MKISARGRYSMQALFDLAHHSHGQAVPLHAIAERQKLSLPFLEQIFNKLKKAGVVASVRGPKGGYVLTRACDQVSVGEVLRLTDPGFHAAAKLDPKAARKTMLEDERMSHLLWRQLDEHIATFLEKVTIADLCSESLSNTCPDCTCPEYVKGVQDQMQNGKTRGCAALLS
ncbi:MAG TPA: Rrf2 family transcriptional regulator [Holophagaceae bacterium]|nr:Rrf2 family transcriptional regulator [Holophagaceae bacterium]